MMRMVWCLLAFGLLGLSINQLHAGAVPGGGNLQVVGEARNKLIPIALEGFAGEVAGVLKFDLEVMGCKVVPLADAAFVVRGKADGSVVGALTDKAGNPGFNRRYSGGNLRDQAHALSNDVIQALTGVPGIASTRVLFKMKTGPRAEEVFLSDYDGHKPVALTNDKTLVSAPRWSPDHSKVFYTTWLKRGGIENTTVIQQNMKTGEREVMARYRGIEHRRGIVAAGISGNDPQSRWQSGCVCSTAGLEVHGGPQGPKPSAHVRNPRRREWGYLVSGWSMALLRNARQRQTHVGESGGPRWQHDSHSHQRCAESFRTELVARREINCLHCCDGRIQCLRGPGARRSRHGGGCRGGTDLGTEQSQPNLYSQGCE